MLPSVDSRLGCRTMRLLISAAIPVSVLLCIVLFSFLLPPSESREKEAMVRMTTYSKTLPCSFPPTTMIWLDDYYLMIQKDYSDWRMTLSSTAANWRWLLLERRQDDRDCLLTIYLVSLATFLVRLGEYKRSYNSHRKKEGKKIMHSTKKKS